ncbi:hypothetical protein LK09_15285 [Microbacterium mangrovi]|uniref:YcaO domain-containing protein n=1 Tax=Microbacterium mangrovi TaxID=1348253 RepID=A0A0B2A418_9MICO|nr:YcaO-like family protein [Microbacterium mangrovi]KHK96352.1 hypothetical protein LK09_15285 [Microbacterium mangrovi]
MLRIDVAATLARRTGVVREVRVIPPDGVERALWTVACDVGIGDRRCDDSPLDITWVGAAGLRRAGTMVRAAGESIERCALSIAGAGLGGGDLPWAPRGSSWAPDAESGTVHTYRALTVTGGAGRPTRVPAAAVDYPPFAESTNVDPGPSGTASGIGRAMALRSAAKETIERDAAMRAWYRPDRALRLPADFSRLAPPEVVRVVEWMREAGVEVRCFALDAAGDAPVVLALAVDHERGVVGAGLGLESLTSLSVVRAVQESLQIRTLLLDLTTVSRPARLSGPVEREIDRARYWSGPAAIPAALRWVEQTKSDARELPHKPAITDWTALLDTYTAVELTRRLPARARELGWSVVRLFCPSMQPLRMSEALAWNALAPVGSPTPHPFV